jgi:hypothetical protein
VLVAEDRLVDRDLRVQRQRLHAPGALMAEDAHASRAGRVPLDVAFRGERVEQVAYRLRRLDAKLLADLADARLVRVLREKVDQVLVDFALGGGERLGHEDLR